VGAYTLTSAGYKKYFKGILLITHIWSNIKEDNGVKHQDPEVMLQFDRGEEFRMASKSNLELSLTKL
jgi:hypothetical protein